MSKCNKFTPNIFHKTKCSNCFRQKEEHSAEALECNRATRSIARSGYLFVAPDQDFSVPLNRTKRWQRRYFVLYDDGELNYSVDEHPDTVPQGSVDMCEVVEVTGAEELTGHPHSLALTSPNRVTFVKAASREEARWWAEILSMFPRRHKRNATFPGGRASPSLPQLGRSASPQPPRSRHLSITGPSPKATNFETPPLKERESPPKEAKQEEDRKRSLDRLNKLNLRPHSFATPILDVTPPPQSLTNSMRSDCVITSGSPPTRDKLRCEDKLKSRNDWRTDRLRDIATALTDRSPEPSLALPAEGLLHLKKGWLWMRTSDDSWVLKWIVLCVPTLQIHANKEDEQGTPEVNVDLPTVTNYREVPTDIKKYVFEIHWAGPILTLSAATEVIRSNWLQALRKAVPLPAKTPESPIPSYKVYDSPMSPSCKLLENPISPCIPRSVLGSSDDEYRTASEGGRRGSEDFGELPPSPPLNRPTSMNKVKDRARLRPRLPRCQSRQSTLDSTSTDEFDCAKEIEIVEIHNLKHKQNDEIFELQKKLAKAEDEIVVLEEEIARLKKFQSDAAIREKKAKDMLSSWEKTELELNQRNSQIELKFLKEQRSLQRQLVETEEIARTHEEKCNILAEELEKKQMIVRNLQKELNNTNERLAKEKNMNDKLNKKVQELEEQYYTKTKPFPADSISDLININLDLDLETLNENELREFCLELMSRFERAIIEIRAVKRALKESEQNYDKIELDNFSLQSCINIMNKDHQAELALLVQRIDHLTSQLTSADRQLKIKSKTEGKDKRRSQSLKGRESFSINKEMEDKVTELEVKILALEKNRNRRRHKRDRSSDSGSPIDDKYLRRLRRKSLDSATCSEPLKLLMRLSSLESKVTNANASDDCISVHAGSTCDLTKIKDETGISVKTNCNNVDIEYLLCKAKIKVNECLGSVSVLKSNRKKSSSPSIDKLISLENDLNELEDILNRKDCIINTAEVQVINSSAGAVVKQLQTLLIEKLKELSEKKRLLQETNCWNNTERLKVVAEKIAYENILVSRIQEAVVSPVSGEAVCDRLVNKECKETAYLMLALQNKVNGTNRKIQPLGRTGAEHLSQILAKCLISAAQGFIACKNFVATKGPSMNLLCDEKQKLDSLLDSYKITKLPQLADALASETMSLAANDKKSNFLQSLSEKAVNEFSKTARNIADDELIQSEINHVLLRAAQIYQSNMDTDHAHFFSFFASERATLELWADSVSDFLYSEINKSIQELTNLYQNSLNKLQKQNWRRRVELERNSKTPTTLLHEYADIIAHKALIDARIAVLNGNHVLNVDDNDPDYDVNCNSLVLWLQNEENWSYLENQSLLLINQSIEAEFSCMLQKFSGNCYAMLNQPELKELLEYLNELTRKVGEIQKSVNLPLLGQQMGPACNWNDVYIRCHMLRQSLEEIHENLERSPPMKRNSSVEENRPIYLGTEYLTQVENLRAAYKRALESCKERHRGGTDIEQLQKLCEKVLKSMEQWHCRTIQELREAHAQEVELLKEEKEQALAEETQATLAALDAMKKAHVAEVQREIAKFKQDYARQQRDDIFDLSEKLSVKSLEAAALEQQLGSATRQLAHAQQHILRLERNPQLSSVQN